MSEDEFVALLANMMDEKWFEYLEKCRTQGREDLKHPHWIWNAFVLSFSTFGRVPRATILTEIRVVLSWENVVRYPIPERQMCFALELRAHGIRFPNRKAGWLNKCVDWIQRDGGTPETIKEKWLSLDANAAKDMLMKDAQLSGISEKYARNIGMDVADNRFDNFAALDARIRSILKHVDCGLHIHDNWPYKNEYSKGEAYIQHVARRLAVTRDRSVLPWHVDRTLFFRQSDFCALAGIGHQRAPRPDRYCRTAS